MPSFDRSDTTEESTNGGRRTAGIAHRADALDDIGINRRRAAQAHPFGALRLEGRVHQ